MIRVAFLSPTLHIGGAENWILTLAQQFVHCSPVGVFVTEPHYHPDQMRRAKQIMPVAVARDGQSVADLRRVISELCNDADVLITWGDERLPAFRWDGRGHEKINIPIVEVSHGDGAWAEVQPDELILYPQRNLIEQSYRGATHYTAVSEAAKTAYPDDVRDGVMVIPNGVDVNRCVPRHSRQQVIQQYRLHNYEKIVLFLGRYSVVKQPMMVVEAAKLLPENWCTVMFGHGEAQLVGDLREAAEGFLNIQIHDPIQHPGDILQLADVMAMPSIAEGHPLTANEAWLAGVPVVSSPFRFATDHQKMFDIVCEDATPEIWAKALQLAANTEKSGVRYYEATQNYTAPAFAQRWEEYLYAVTGSKLREGIFGG